MIRLIVSILILLVLGACSSLNNLSSDRRDQLEFRAFTEKTGNSELSKERKINDVDIAACFQGKISETIKKVKTEIASVEKDKWQYWGKMAACHFMEGEISLAIYYNQLIIKDFASSKKSKAFPYNNMGVIYFEKNMPRQAEAFFLKAKEISPNSLSVQYNLSSLYLHYGEFDKALGIFNKIKKDVYADKELFYSYALALTYKGEFSTLNSALKRVASETKDFDKLKLLQALQNFVSGKKVSAYETVKNIKGRYLSSVEEDAKDKIIEIYEKEIEAKKKLSEKKNEK